jgi:hypothetical protein
LGKSDWLDVVRSVAPTLATALGGPLTGAAVSALSEAILGQHTTDAHKVRQVIEQADAKTLAQIKAAEDAFTVRMTELGVDLEKLAAQDRASARDMAARTSDVYTPRWLAVGVTIGFFSALAAMMTGHATKSDEMMVMLGSLGTAWTGIIAYYFGSSAGSQRKSELLARAEPGNNT